MQVTVLEDPRKRPIKWPAWGRNIAEWRSARGYRSQRAFASALGVSKSAVQWWEDGRVAPRDEMKATIAAFLNVKPEVLFPLEVKR